MEFLQTAARVRVLTLSECASTNTELLALAARETQLSPLLVLTAKQTAGRGRQQRTWQDMPGKALATSYLIPNWPLKGLSPSWAPLMAGHALAGALQTHLAVEIKWPNDVLVPQAASGGTVPDEISRRRGGAKLAGILCELAPGSGIVCGAGINLFQNSDELPPGAASLVSSGAVPAGLDITAGEGQRIADGLTADYVSRLAALVQMAGRDPRAVREQIMVGIATLGRRVRVLLPDGRELMGTASGLGPAGELEVTDSLDTKQLITAGDVEHLCLL